MSDIIGITEREFQQQQKMSQIKAGGIKQDNNNKKTKTATKKNTM